MLQDNGSWYQMKLLGTFSRGLHLQDDILGKTSVVGRHVLRVEAWTIDYGMKARMVDLRH